MNPFLLGKTPTIHGECHPAFSEVRDVFTANFFDRGHDGEVGAACCVMIDGRVVVDLYGGYAEPETDRPWTRDTISCSWSVGKAALTTLGLMLVDQGKLDLDAPVGRYWPEFSSNGKEAVLVRHLFDHRAGVSYVDADLSRGTSTTGTQWSEQSSRPARTSLQAPGKCIST